VRERLAEISVSILVVCGEDYRPNIANPKAPAARIPRAELRIIPGANHLWNLQATLFSKTISRFLDRSSAASRNVGVVIVSARAGGAGAGRLWLEVSHGTSA
jgi:hypothetical protein